MATVYLATTGSDSYTYVQAQNPATPWLTPSKVNTSATTGDTVSIAAGTYTSGMQVSFTKSFTWVGAGASTTIFDWGGLTSNYFRFEGTSQTFSGIKFYNLSYNALYACPFMAGAGTVSTCTMTSCIIDTVAVNDLGGLSIGGLFGGYTVTFNTNLTNCLISNVTYNLASVGTCLFHSRSSSSTVTMNKCTIYLPSTAKPIVSIVQQGANLTLTGKNNIIYATPTIPWGTVGTNTITYSDGYNISSFPANTGNITTDPLFVDVANGNYNLRPASPALDTGSPT